MKRIGLEFNLGKLQCIDEADKAGNSEPYLWSVFFKIDGTNCILTEDVLLAGKATIRTSPGNHGDFVGGGGMDAGQVKSIPLAIGHWKTALVPIPSVGSKKLKVGGVAGCVVVVLEEDETPNAAMAKGHIAFNKAVQRELDALIPTFGLDKQVPTKADVEAIEKKVKAAIHDAVAAEVGIGEGFTALFSGGQDDIIGTFNGIWSHGDLADSIGKGPIDLYSPDLPAQLKPLLGGHLLDEEDGVYKLIDGSVTVKDIVVKLGGSGSTQKPKVPKVPKDPDSDTQKPSKNNSPGKKGPEPPN